MQSTTHMFPANSGATRRDRLPGRHLAGHGKPGGKCDYFESQKLITSGPSRAWESLLSRPALFGARVFLSNRSPVRWCRSRQPDVPHFRDDVNDVLEPVWSDRLVSRVGCLNLRSGGSSEVRTRTPDLHRRTCPDRPRTPGIFSTFTGRSSSALVSGQRIPSSGSTSTGRFWRSLPGGVSW